MPLYDYKCPCCERKLKDRLVKDKDEEVKCIQCNTPMHRLFPSSVSVQIFPSEGIFFEHTSDKGDTFYSKKEMKEFSKKTGTVFDMLE